MPEQYIADPAFYVKLLFIMLAGVNLAAFYATGALRKVDTLAAGDDAPSLARAIAPYLGNAL